MNLKESWQRFKESQPKATYSYVWWETIIMFSLLPIAIVFLYLSIMFANVWLAIVSFIFIVADCCWSHREIKGRKKYYET